MRCHHGCSPLKAKTQSRPHETQLEFFENRSQYSSGQRPRPALGVHSASAVWTEQGWNVVVACLCVSDPQGVWGGIITLSEIFPVGIL